MTSAQLILLFLAFVVKHFICDFLLQRSYQYRNKGIYGHPGGILHAGIHAAGTVLVLLLWPFSWTVILLLALAEAVVHYHIDWLKCDLTRRYQWNSSQDAFWIALGADQMLHYLTYVGLIGIVAL